MVTLCHILMKVYWVYLLLVVVGCHRANSPNTVWWCGTKLELSYNTHNVAVILMHQPGEV